MKTLKEFYQAYAAWLDAGAPHLKPFSRAFGLCRNLPSFTEECHALLNEMVDQFEAAGLDHEYPFGGEDNYYTRCDYSTQHLNPERIKWVKDHANNQ